MANAAPYIASPIRRLFAGAVDLALCCVVMVIGFALLLSASEARTLSGPAVAGIAFLAYFGYHTIFYAAFHGQTPALALFGVRVARAADGLDVHPWQAAMRAGVRPGLVYVLGWGAVLADHGEIGTASLIALAIATLELGMMFILPTRQTLSDLTCRTLVINAPSPQPHRAPAGPMYSARDAEFGVRPQRRS
jgi:uncharacterized RDD family membrane protein YckC